MILVPDPHKTRHKKMTGELIPSPSCNWVSSPYQGLLLRLKCTCTKCTIQLNLRSALYSEESLQDVRTSSSCSWLLTLRPSLDNVTVSISSSAHRRMSLTPDWLHHTSQLSRIPALWSDHSDINWDLPKESGVMINRLYYSKWNIINQLENLL